MVYTPCGVTSKLGSPSLFSNVSLNSSLVDLLSGLIAEFETKVNDHQM
jgi:hypothetical protein